MANPSELEGCPIILWQMQLLVEVYCGFSMITCPLHDLLKKSTPFEWTEEHQVAFDALKHAIIMAPVLKTP
jgi:hypothetical protein